MFKPAKAEAIISSISTLEGGEVALNTRAIGDGLLVATHIQFQGVVCLLRRGKEILFMVQPSPQAMEKAMSMLVNDYEVIGRIDAT